MPLPRVVLHCSEVSDNYGRLLQGRATSNMTTVKVSRDLKELSFSLLKIKEIAQVAADIFDGLAGLTRDFSTRIDLVTERSANLLERMCCIPMDHVPRWLHLSTCFCRLRCSIHSV